jgi:hypothetical protein
MSCSIGSPRTRHRRVVNHLQLFVFIQHAVRDHFGYDEDCGVILLLVAVLETDADGFGAEFLEFFAFGIFGRGTVRPGNVWPLLAVNAGGV